MDHILFIHSYIGVASTFWALVNYAAVNTGVQTSLSFHNLSHHQIFVSSQPRIEPEAHEEQESCFCKRELPSPSRGLGSGWGAQWASHSLKGGTSMVPTYWKSNESLARG